jgi:hypothetical protein
MEVSLLVSYLKGIFTNNQNDLAFVIGNGINRYNNFKNNISWEDILKELWHQVYDREIPKIPSGISLTEFYDILELGITTKNLTLNLQNEFCGLMFSWVPTTHHKKITKSIMHMGVPILTTNFENILAESVGLNFFKMEETKFTDFYPWGCYYSNAQLDLPTSGFGIWHINGMQKYHRSIRLGLTHYMGSVERARNLIHKGIENTLFTGKDVSNWRGYKTWLHIFFNKSLVFIGLGLEENEVFLRWLLIERSKYYKKYPERSHNSWYLTVKNSCMDGKRLYLDSIGIKVVEFDNYEDIYENIWRPN